MVSWGQKATASSTVWLPPAACPQCSHWRGSQTLSAQTGMTGNGAQAGGCSLGSSQAVFLPWGSASLLWGFVLQEVHMERAGNNGPFSWRSAACLAGGAFRLHRHRSRAHPVGKRQEQGGASGQVCKDKLKAESSFWDGARC